MAPEPRLKVKNACPTAATKVEPVTLEKSGFKYHIIPSFAPGRVTERITNTINNTSNAGITIDETFSIPSVIPLIITMVLIAKYIIVNRAT